MNPIQLAAGNPQIPGLGLETLASKSRSSQSPYLPWRVTSYIIDVLLSPLQERLTQRLNENYRVRVLHAMPRKQKRLLDAPQLEPFFAGVDEFCDLHLPKDHIDARSAPVHKIIADPVEGYSSIDSWEVSIIDTALFQRLRGIRQLGLAYLVYPTLGYSRFEHVIGVRARLDQVLTTLRQNQALRAQGEPLPTDRQTTRMRLAVLCHDIGHCLFSHVSENILERLSGNADYPSASLIMREFETWAGRHIPMAEILSVAILTSPSFIDFLTRIGVETGGQGAAERLADDAAHLILGLPIPGDANSLFLAQLMNSGLDVDKLDYMLREALLSGITLGISLDWLMKKLFIASLPGNQLPPGLSSRLGGFNIERQFAVLSLEKGGQFAFEEFCVARLALHEKIYGSEQEFDEERILRGFSDLLKFNEFGIGHGHALGLQQ